LVDFASTRKVSIVSTGFERNLKKTSRRTLTFIERNQNFYEKVEDVPESLIEKYTGILPDELIEIWKNMA